MLRSVIVVLFVGMVATSSGCMDLQITYEIPSETCLRPSTPEVEPSPGLLQKLLHMENTNMAPEFMEAAMTDADNLDVAIGDCFLDEQEARPELGARHLTVALEVADDGSVVDESIELHPTWDASNIFDSCVKRAIRKSDFSNVDPGPIEIPYDFNPYLPQ